MTMKTEAEVKKMIAKLKRDPHFKRSSATVYQNAPLALIQCNIEGKIEALKWVIADK